MKTWQVIETQNGPRPRKIFPGRFERRDEAEALADGIRSVNKNPQRIQVRLTIEPRRFRAEHVVGVYWRVVDATGQIGPQMAQNRAQAQAWADQFNDAATA